MEKSMKSGLSKKLILIGLYTASFAVIFSGVFFSAYSVISDVRLTVLGNSIPGIVFGIMVFYLGLRYFLNVIKFHEEVKETGAEFSWSNFKKKKRK